MDAQGSFTLKNRLSELERASRFVEEVGKRCGLPAKAIFETNLALDEVLTNLISYAYEDAGEHDIVVRLKVYGEEIALEVEDDGRPFNPLEVTPPRLDVPVDQRPVGGLGIHLVRKVMDGLEYKRHGGKNLLVMKKRVVAGKHAALPTEIEEATEDGIAVVSLKGRLDADNAPTLEAKLHEITASTSRLVLDCTHLDYIGSAGLRVVLVVAKRLLGSRGQLALSSLKDPVKQIFDIAGFSAIIPLYQTRDEAVAAARRGRGGQT
jgi:serine/threonine-protein kinase RsbW